MPWTSLCELSELKEGEGRAVEIDSHRLAVFLHQGQPRVIDNVCPHAGAPLDGGWIDDAGCAVCPWHGWAFDLQSGRIKGGGAVMIGAYPVRVYEYEGRQLVQAELR
ncbi:MAG TPA: Rieske (2Fe-2S) protein [Tepidisphaeraceae bacterium]